MEALVSTVFPNHELVEVDASEEDLVCFSRRPADNRYLANDFTILSPEEPITNDTTVLTYNLPRSMLPRYISLSEILVAAVVSLCKQEEGRTAWEAVTDADNCAPVSFLADVLFEKVTLLPDDRFANRPPQFFKSRQHFFRLLFRSRSTSTTPWSAPPTTTGRSCATSADSWA